VFEQILLAGSFAFAAAILPGPFQAYLIASTLTNGFRRTVLGAFAPLLSDIPIFALVLLVLTSIPPVFVVVLQFVGGSFLLYLAYGTFRLIPQYQHAVSHPPRSDSTTFFKAVLVNLLNPNAYLGTALIMGPLVARAWLYSPLQSLAVIATFYGIMTVVTIAILAIFARARSINPRLARVLVGFSAVALALFGLYQLWSGGEAFLRL
jgi:threonine/homoserine/homoserine lactone efflux protein